MSGERITLSELRASVSDSQPGSYKGLALGDLHFIAARCPTHGPLLGDSNCSVLCLAFDDVIFLMIRRLLGRATLQKLSTGCVFFQFCSNQCLFERTS